MNIYEISEKSGISIRTLRKLDHLKVLKHSENERPDLSKMLYTLRKGNPLTTLQLTTLIEDGGQLYELGPYIDRAEAQLYALRNPQENKATNMASVVDLAAKNEPTQVAKLIDWLKATIPSAGEVSHHYLAVRLLLGTGPHLRAYVAGRIPRAFLNCRADPEFDGWFTMRRTNSRKATFYLRPTGFIDL